MPIRTTCPTSAITKITPISGSALCKIAHNLRPADLIEKIATAVLWQKRLRKSNGALPVFRAWLGMCRQYTTWLSASALRAMAVSVATVLNMGAGRREFVGNGATRNARWSIAIAT
jgi:hypothetical protein